MLIPLRAFFSRIRRRAEGRSAEEERERVREGGKERREARCAWGRRRNGTKSEAAHTQIQSGARCTNISSGEKRQRIALDFNFRNAYLAQEFMQASGLHLRMERRETRKGLRHNAKTHFRARDLRQGKSHEMFLPPAAKWGLANNPSNSSEVRERGAKQKKGGHK